MYVTNVIMVASVVLMLPTLFALLALASPHYLHYLQYLSTLFAQFTLPSTLFARLARSSPHYLHYLHYQAHTRCTFYTIWPTLFALFTLSGHLICTIYLHVNKNQGACVCRGKTNTCGMSLDHGVLGGTLESQNVNLQKQTVLPPGNLKTIKAFPNLGMMQLCTYKIICKSVLLHGI